VQDLRRTDKCIKNFVRGWLGRKHFAEPGVNDTLTLKQVLSIGGFKVFKWIQHTSFFKTRFNIIPHIFHVVFFLLFVRILFFFCELFFFRMRAIFSVHLF